VSAFGRRVIHCRTVSLLASKRYAPTVWKRPFLPAELVANQEFRTIVDGQLNTAERTLNQFYAGRDQAIKLIAAMAAEHTQLKQADTGIPKMFGSNIADAGVFVETVLQSGGRLDKLERCGSDLRLLAGRGIDPVLAALTPPQQSRVWTSASTKFYRF